MGYSTRQSLASRVWALAARQHGVVAHWQLLELGMTAQAIKHRVARGRLHRVRRGVYAVGRPDLTREGRWMAAVLACGPGGVLGDLAGAALWEEAGVHPELNVGLPRLPWVVGPLTGVLPRHPLTDRVLNRFIERWTVPRLTEAGYVDCWRRLHPHGDGYTCATWLPAARIDYIFADRHMAPRLEACDVVGGDGVPDPDVPGASDHLPVVADFRV
jgi:hypothetical protein